MKKAIAVLVLLTSAMFTFQPATADEVPAPVSSVEEVITAPVVDLPVTEPTVTTEPAPVTVAEPAPVAAEPVVEAPVADPVVTDPVVVPEPVVSAPVETAPVCENGWILAEDHSCVNPNFYDPAPVCQEDEPCWNCETMGNRTCGPGAGESIDNWLLRACFGPILHEYPNIMRTCKYQEAMENLPAGHTWIGTGPQADTCSTYWIASVKHENTIHNYKLDGSVSSYEPCNYIPVRATVQ